MSFDNKPLNAYPLGPSGFSIARDENIAIIRLCRPQKRNSLNDEIVLGLSAFFASLPGDVEAIVIQGEGDHFCAGLDLNEVQDTDLASNLNTTTIGQRLNDLIQSSRAAVVCVMHGAVIGAGLEMAAACHIRIAEKTAYYALPEGMRGIFLGSGGSVRIPRLIGAERVQDMMLTGRTYGAEEGYALGFSQYLAEPGMGFAKAVEVAKRITQNTAMANFAILHALPRIVEEAPSNGLLTERLMATIACSDEDAQQRLQDFLVHKRNKVSRG